GEPPKQWFSTSTMAMWHKDISQIQVKELLFCIQKVSSYGVMIDESTRDIKCCNGETIAKTVKEIIQASNLDVQNCLVWLTDNTAYLTGKNKGLFHYLQNKQ
ncbi:486_t:CDS:2, partial [Gigaspora margarita]